jgi:uncharacterized protein
MRKILDSNLIKSRLYIMYMAAIVLFTNICFSQEADSVSVPVSYVNVLARFKDGKGIEIRFFPDNKSVLEEGLKNGFVIERSLFDPDVKRKETDTINYVEIAKVFPYKDPEWEKLINGEKNPEAKNELEIARDFLNNISKKQGGTFNLDKGIAELKEQKSKEDYEYMVFALSALQNANVASALGLGFTDNNIDKGKSYFYRVRLLGKPGIYKVIPIDCLISAEINKKGYDNPVYVKQGDTQLFFAWLDKPELSGYFIERAGPGESAFTQLNKAPIHSLEGSGYSGESRSGYNDKNLTNYKTYTYRFYAYTLFGEKVKLAEVKAMPKDLTPPEQPFLQQPQHVKPKEVLLTWKMNPNPAPDLKGFYVARSNSNEGEFKVLNRTLISEDTRTFTDTSFIPGQQNYYLVQAVDTAKNISSSFPVSVTLIDSIPPVKPVFVSGKIDSLGVVTIIVQKNKEKDLMGYRLYKSNSPEHEFSVMQENFVNSDSLIREVQTVFKDTVTLNSLTPFIYYKIRALDFNYNQSQFSEILKVARPDTIPPVPPVFNDVIVRENEIELHFVPSSSRDVKEQIIYRKTDSSSKWEKLVSVDSVASKFIDTTVTIGITYFYSMRSKDFSGNFSKYTSPVYGKPYDTGVRPPVKNFNASADKKNIILKWDYPQLKTEPRFVVYKKDSKGELVEYADTKEKMFIDKNTGKENFYAVKVFTNDGGQSKISPMIGKSIE